MSVGKKIASLCLVSLVILAATAVVIEGTTRRLTDIVQQFNRQREFRNGLDAVWFLNLDAGAGVRRYVITGNDRDLDHYRSVSGTIGQVIQGVSELAAGSHAARPAQLKEIESLIQQRLALLEQIVTAQSEQGFDTARRLLAAGNEKDINDTIRQKIAEIVEDEDRAADAQSADARVTTATARSAVRIAMALALLFLSALGYATATRIARPMHLLAAAARRVGRGELDQAVVVNSNDEVGVLSVAFNQMTTNLRTLMATLTSTNVALEAEILERKQAQAEIHQLNAELNQRATQLEEANKELESFSYSVSHDLRAPLRHVQGYVELLERVTEGKLPEKAGRYLRTITDASIEMGQLIDDLLEFSRTGRAEMQATAVALDSLLQDSIRDLEMATQGRTIVWEIAPLPHVMGDPAMLRQVLANLVGNAVKYSRQRDPAQIAIGCAGEENGRAILFVRDNGAGFDMKYVDRLFGVFQRLHRAEEFEGTGIGLATVRRIITRHGGRVWAEATPNEGATFYFTVKLVAG
ncbi:MAG: CHASE3 domain-containing protein [Deltaproteobacteria bacterium]|nr:CHASE3 domain-containing protein [Deltaproteobacteria bacterium]